jgi:ABC-type bacteriocin/lantibiotic exporter with double-glycine peptidase domain
MLIQNQPTEAIIPTIGLFVAAAFRILPSISRILNSFQQISLTKPSIELLYNEFIIINNNKQENDKPNDDLVLSNKIVLSNISFQYPNTSINTLTSICLEIKIGEFIGFIGKSGSGKSTLIDTILGLLEPQHGEVLIDGFNITKNLRGWQNQIGYVPQTIYLTDENLINNIAFGIEDKDIDLNAVKKAISLAQLDELVESLPNGLNTIVGERGIRLSGGQRQRIGIARALYYNPSILVLDEATSSLDLDTEMSVMKSVNSLHGQKTIIVVAHRMSTLSNCDKIYKLSNGEIISEGTPDKMII